MNDFFRKYYLSESISIIEQAIEKYNPSNVFVAYSGGRDSAIALDIATKIFSHVQVMAIDTGLAHDKWRSIVERNVGQYKNTSLTIVEGLSWEWFSGNVLEYGFGYTPRQHSIYYRMLKERAINSLIQSSKTHYYDKIAFITGVRRAESTKRLKTPDVMCVGARVTINAIAHYDNLRAKEYHALNLPNYHNDCYSDIGNSGDCACNWTLGIKLADLEKTSPNLFEKMKALSDESLERGGWCYGTRPPRELAELDNRGEDMPNDSLCISCYSKRLI